KMAVEVLDDQEMREAQRDYLDFLDDDQDQGIYQSKVRQMISENKSRLTVNLNDLRRRNEKRAAKLLNNAFEELLAFQHALKDLVASIDATYAKQHEEFFIGLEGSFGSKHVSPRTLTSRLLGSMVCLDGIVTKCSLVRPKVVRSVHYCPATKKTMERKYTDMTSLDAFPSSAIYPTMDEENNPLETEFGLSIYKDHQTITVQEMPEKAPAGQLPRSVDIILDNDLVDAVKPGDRTQVIGTYRCLPGKKGGFTSGTFRTIMIACHVKQMSKEVSHFFSADDVAKIKSFCRTRSKNLFDQLARSLAPSIHGHEYIKKAILCMLLGGVEKVLENGSRIRGDINVLLIGDPSVAKSQLLRYVLHTAPRAIPTTGRGSSGVGLTAAVTTDQETGERRLEAGAMVLGDRGVVCIDEFDKMSDMDRTAIHEVMEQGRVTIAKAGIHARLNARCSVLAAANPVYGRVCVLFGVRKILNMGLHCFIMLFLTLLAPKSQNWEYLPFGNNDRSSNDLDALATEDPDVTQEEEEELQVYEKHNPLLHGSKKVKDRVVSKAFMRKYIHVAKALSPVLTQDAANRIAEEYSRLRNQEQLGSDIARTSPVTARTLETLIRLSTAHAKARMSKVVELVDTDVAVELVQFAYFKKVLEKDRKRSRNGEQDAEDEEEDEVQDTPRRLRKRTADCFGCCMSDAPCVCFCCRLKEFKTALLEVFRSSHAQSVGMIALMEGINKSCPSPFKESEVRAALSRMQDDNQAMVADDIIFLI
uniref:DNA replication licensing factor MCM3 n=1 Tax=Sinocyclocheilus anshuiensis TaxID=1608454 RepID=A0A671Q174_9TELE